MGTTNTMIAAEITCWGDWIGAIRSQRPGLYCVAGGVASGKNAVLEATRHAIEAEGGRVVDSIGIVDIDSMLEGMVVLQGEVRDVAGLQRAIDLSVVGATVLCSIHAYEVKDAVERIQSPVFGGSLGVVAPFLRAVMAQVRVPKIRGGLTCLNEIAVFQTVPDVQMVLSNGPGRSLREDADSKIAAGILTRESAVQAGALHQ